MVLFSLVVKCSPVVLFGAVWLVLRSAVWLVLYNLVSALKCSQVGIRLSGWYCSVWRYGVVQCGSYSIVWLVLLCLVGVV